MTRATSGRAPVHDIFPLLVAWGKNRQVVFRPASVGRKAGSDIFLADEYASPEHCAFIPVAGRWTVIDRGSTNGTLVNGVKAWGPRELDRGDKILVGHHGADRRAVLRRNR
jgi:pSer/pThr/pTyr-binding forkhead associated (FHA) protein